MALPLELILEDDQRQALELMRDTDAHPYLRERAAALLKIADGAHPQSARQVALHGLLKSRQPDTIYAWIKRFQSEGIEGLKIKAGRGRKPVFSPSALNRRERPSRVALPHTP